MHRTVEQNFSCIQYVLFRVSCYQLQVRDQDVIYGLAGISWEGGETAWSWLKVTSQSLFLILLKLFIWIIFSHFIDILPFSFF